MAQTFILVPRVKVMTAATPALLEDAVNEELAKGIYDMDRTGVTALTSSGGAWYCFITYVDKKSTE